MPELSYGSHMFQDLVEAEIVYGAIWNDRKTIAYHPELLTEYEDVFVKICPEYPELAGMIRVAEVEKMSCSVDAVSNHAICGIEK